MNAPTLKSEHPIEANAHILTLTLPDSYMTEVKYPKLIIAWWMLRLIWQMLRGHSEA